MLVVPFTTPTLNRWLPWPLTPCLDRSGFSKSWLSLSIISEEWWLSSLLPLIHLEFLFVFPSFLESWPCFLLIIQAFSLPYGLLQCLGIIILYFVTFFWVSGCQLQPVEVLGQFMFLVWNATGTFFSILDIFNMPKNLIKIQDSLIWFNGFALSSPTLQSDSGAESYGSSKLVGS